MLQAAGMPAGISPELFCLENPEVLKKIHLAYLKAGSNIITSCTFGANPFKLPPNADVEEINRQLTAIARQALSESGKEGPLFVAGNIGPSGKFAKPLGDIAPDALIEGFRRQIKGLVAGGADLIFMETQFDLAETRAAIIAARSVCDLPLMASMTFEQGVSLTGSTAEIFAETMQNLGCDVIGTNCSMGPDEMLPVVKDLLACSTAPVMAEPNAGLPKLVDGKTVFPQQPEAFAQKTAAFAKLGVQILGGCCGTTPDHIKTLVKACQNINRAKPSPVQSSGIVLTSRSKIVRIGENRPLAVIGERINPTGKPKLGGELQKGEFAEALRLADEQISSGANVLDVNVGAPLVDETKVLPELVSLLVGRQLAPLSLDSPNNVAIVNSLPWCPGSFLVNSISGENKRMEFLGPVCRNFGAPFILLPLSGSKLPVTAQERIAIIEKLLTDAEALKIPKRLIMVDVLALAVSSTPDAAKACLQTLAWCREQKLATTLGLSNISFGLPARDLLNATFLCMAVGAGLASCIANPGAPRVAEALAAIAALAGWDKDAEQFISTYKDWKNNSGAMTIAASKKASATLYDAVLLGDRENILPVLEKELASGKKPMAIVNEVLIPAITEVGNRYERREYFLPQLIRSAETMQKAVAHLQPMLDAGKTQENLPAVVMATVEGDIHDIGKNIVCLLLGNHGFKVIDAGKDVPAEKILEIAKNHNAKLIGLSALMTTTMTRMEDTIKLIQQNSLPIKVMVGGAAVTPEFAASIGADAYCRDAVAAVTAAKDLLAA